MSRPSSVNGTSGPQPPLGTSTNSSQGPSAPTPQSTHPDASPTLSGSTPMIATNPSSTSATTTAGSANAPVKPIVHTPTVLVRPHANASSTRPFHIALSDTLFWSALCALALVTFVSLITFKSSSLDWPLANISVSTAIFLLTVAVKLTDWALESLGDLGWEKLYWGPILQRHGNFATHLLMTSGFGAWFKALLNPPDVEAPSSLRVVNFFRRVARCRGPQLWAFFRIAIWLLIQVPGIIVMSSASPRTAYHPSGYSTVSGGMGIFNASEAIEFPGEFVVYNYAFSILQDRAMATNTGSIGKECQGRDTCKASLLVGGLNYIAPWPYMWLPNDEMSAYLTQDMPVYQLEGWNTTTDKSISWSKDECRVYQASILSIQICAKESDKGGSILTGIRACDISGLDDEGDCSLSPGWPSWNSFAAFSTTLDIYRLNVSLAAGRQTGEILEVLDKGKPTLQDIKPSDFLDAFDSLFCPFTPENGTVSRYCEPDQLRHAATANLWASIYRSYTPQASESSLAVDDLRNLYATALFLYNPVFYMTLSFDSLPFSLKPFEGLADENYFPGSPARPSTYLSPAFWTVLVFTVLAGLLIVASIVAVVVALWFNPPETSKFGILDAFKVDVVPPPGTVPSSSTDLGAFAHGKSDAEVLRLAQGLRVKLKQG